MLSGSLRKRLTILQPGITQTGTGNPRAAWTQFATVWGAIEPQDGEEAIRAGAVNARVPVRFVLRYLAGVTTAMRISMGGRTFQIESVKNVDERNRELNLIGVEVK